MRRHCDGTSSVPFMRFCLFSSEGRREFTVGTREFTVYLMPYNNKFDFVLTGEGFLSWV